MNVYNVKEGQTRCPSNGGPACIRVIRLLPSGNAVVERLKDKARTEMSCERIHSEYCFIVEPLED